MPRTVIPEVVGWKPGEAPTVPAGFRAQAMATGLASPRNVYPLPNGDILVVEAIKEEKEPIERPKSPIFDLIVGFAHRSSQIGPTNRIPCCAKRRRRQARAQPCSSTI